MTIKDIIELLQQQGHDVEYYIRKDGGILIRKIDGKSYQGASGNAVARSMVGAKISEARRVQLHRITVKRTTGDTDVDKELRKTQRVWRKNFGKTPEVGKKTLKKTKQYMEKYGKAETVRRLKEAQRYAEGLAYTENVIQLIQYMIEANNRWGSSALWDVIDKMETNMDKIKERNIKPTYDILYDIDHNVRLNPDNAEMYANEGAYQIRMIHNL